MSSIRERFHDTAGNVTANVTDAARRVRNMYPLAEGLLTGGATAVTAFTPWGLVAHTAEKYVDIWRDIFRDKRYRRDTDRPLLLRRTIRHAAEIILPVGLVLAGQPWFAGGSILAMRVLRGVEEQKIREHVKSGSRRGIL